MKKFRVLVLLFAAVALTAQLPPAPPAQKQAPQADPADVKSMDSILAALYDVISGPAGKKRDWDRFRSLFLPGASLIATGTQPSGEVRARVLTPEDYITRSAPLLEKDGFFEREISRHVDEFGHIAQLFSTYESRHKADEAPFARGINSIQLLNDGQRWWIVTVYWEGESQSASIPPQFLPKK